MNEIETIQKIYNSEINFAILSPCWDGGITVIIGPEFYGQDMSAEKCQYRVDGIETVKEAVAHLVEKVCELYPTSTFAVNYLSENA